MSRQIEWTKELDNEWIELIVEAKNLGIELNSIRDFLKEAEIEQVIIKN